MVGWLAYWYIVYKWRAIFSKRQNIITRWAGEAYKWLCGNESDDFRIKLRLKTGCLIIASGSNDDKIAPGGLSSD